MKRIGLLVVTGFLLLAIYSAVRSKLSENMIAPATEVGKLSPTLMQLSLAQVATHATATDCYQVIDGKIYDITKYISAAIHPGGDNMTPYCGKDSSDIFGGTVKNRKTHVHSVAARAILAAYQVGILTK